MNKSAIIIGVITFIFFSACRDYEAVAYIPPVEVAKYDGTLLEYLSDEANHLFNQKYDSMLVIINGVPQLKEQLENENEYFTIFAVPNECFDYSFEQLNKYRAQKKLGEKISLDDLLIEPFSVDDTTFVKISSNKEDTIIKTRHYDYRGQVDSLLCRYIFTGKYTTEEVVSEAGSMTLESYKYKYQMNLSCIRQPASGIVGEGVRNFTFSDMNNSQLKDMWKSTNVVWHDIYTSNAVIHLLTPQHSFSYDKFINYFKNYGNEKK